MITTLHIRRHRLESDTIVILAPAGKRFPLCFHPITPTDHIESFCYDKDQKWVIDIIGYAQNEEDFDQIVGNTECYTFKSGWTAKREYGPVTVPGQVIPIQAQGKWVLRNQEGRLIDMDKYRSDLFERYPESDDRNLY